MNLQTQRTILLVDDAPANLDLLKGILREQYKIKAATSGAKALQAVRKTPPDLILLDVMMPEMDGYAVCQQLQADSATAAIPVIFVTGHVNAAELARGNALGAVGFVTKPIDPVQLLAQIAALF
ncbi:response regulator [Chromatium okenii]|uniref:response regulator n=1 Tax=Chromatium okenii TaxID=61644 RepID=UPI00190802B9|nr:response regulator [Chromatium okenii]MBK1641810.1 response regulator [Chromatium okenii]